MIWLPRTTDNSTYFAQSLEIRSIESRLYVVCTQKNRLNETFHLSTQNIYVIQFYAEKFYLSKPMLLDIVG